MMDGDAAAIRTPFANAPEEGSATEVAPGILWMRLPLPMALDHVNVFALDDGDGWTLIDTGFDSKRSRSIWNALLDGPLQGRPISRLIVSHHHPDHVGLAGWFQAEFGTELLMTRTAWLMARMLQLDEQKVPSPETLSFWQSAGMPQEILNIRARQRPFNFADVVAHLPLGFTRISDGQHMSFGGRDWTVRLGSGHAPDHATFWSESIVIGGDQLLPSISPNLGVYATEPEADPVADWLHSCAAFGPFATHEQLVLPGHKLPYYGLPLRLRQLSDNHHGALSRLREHLASPRTAAECFQPLFLRSIQDSEYGLALVEAVAHVNHLWRSGEVQKTRRDDGANLWRIIR